MTYLTYKKTLLSIVLLFLLILSWYIFGKHFVFSEEYSLSQDVTFYSFRIVSLFLLLFSIYAAISRVKGTTRLESPIIFILIGVLLTIPSFYRPIYIGYIMKYPNEEGIGILEHTWPNEIEKKAMAMDATSPPSKRLSIARNTYIDTGDIITYLDSNNHRTIYRPDSETLSLHIRKLKTEIRLMKSIRDEMRVHSDIKKKALILICILVTAAICLIAFLWYKFRTGAFGSKIYIGSHPNQ